MQVLKIHTLALLLGSATQALACDDYSCDTSSKSLVTATLLKDDDNKLDVRSVELLPHWSVSAVSNAFSDKLTVSVSTTASKPVKCRWGTKTPTLVMECKEGVTTARFETHCRISASSFDNYGDVTYRIDKLDVQTLTFSESEDNRSMGLWETASSVPFIKSLIDSESLAARIKPYSDEPFVAFFNTRGLSDAIAPIASACDWDKTGG